MTQQELYSSFLAFIDSGDETGARAFLIDHLNDFPEELRKEIAFAFFVEATENAHAVNTIKRSAVGLMKEFAELQGTLEEATQAADLKDTI